MLFKNHEDSEVTQCKILQLMYDITTKSLFDRMPVTSNQNNKRILTSRLLPYDR